MARLLSGPAAPPKGAVTVLAGRDDPAALGAPHTTYWFAAGRHTLGRGRYHQIAAGDGDTYVGAPGAVLSGMGTNLYAFTSKATGVTVEYLTVEDFGKGGDNPTQGVVNHTSGSRWTIEHDTVVHDAGAGVMLGSGDILRDDCLSDNSQYGFSVYSTAGSVHDVVVTGNEIAGNATYNWDAARPGCGCSGGAKFWTTIGAVVSGNYVHGNDNVGLWVDTDNSGFEITDNYISRNHAEGLIYEISYNALIARNTFVDNGWVQGSRPTFGFPESAVYISESGGDRRAPGPYAGHLDVVDNTFVDNWGGVVLWEDAGRFCGNGSTQACTLVGPRLFTARSCHDHLLGPDPRAAPDYFDNCRWKTKNVSVTGNLFVFRPRAIGPSCTLMTMCGYNGLFSGYGTAAPYEGWVVARDISDRQHDVFARNRYEGPWRFDGFALGTRLTWGQWTRGVADVAGSGDTFGGQDAGSTYRG